MCNIFVVETWWDPAHRTLEGGHKIYARKKYHATITSVPECWDYPDEPLTSQLNWFSIKFDAPELAAINCMRADAV